ncbi:MAG: hypothetical protein WA239_00315 [Candidatus Sulfotelmatobacter sp.]
MALVQFVLTVEQELNERTVDIAEADEAEIVGTNADSLAQGLKPY